MELDDLLREMTTRMVTLAARVDELERQEVALPGSLVRTPRNYDADVSLEPGDTVELQVINMTNQDTTSGSQLYGLKIVTDTQSIDTAAGVAIFNIGKSDAVYINLSGKAGAGPYTDNSPTGVGIDLNKEVASSAQRSTSSNQQGVQIFDWSTTDQGTGGPRGVLLLKIGNMNTDHILQTIKANRNALQLVFDSGDAGYDATKPLLRVDDEDDGATKLRIRANGDQVFNGDGLGVQWEMASGNPAYILRSGTNELKVRAGAGGIRFVDNAETMDIAFLHNEAGLIVASLTTTERDAISGLPDGTIIYNSTASKFQGLAGSSWVDFH